MKSLAKAFLVTALAFGSLYLSGYSSNRGSAAIAAPRPTLSPVFKAAHPKDSVEAEVDRQVAEIFAARK